MPTPSLDWQSFPLFTFSGIFLGMLGAFYLIYDFLGRPQRILQRCFWSLSSGFLVTIILIGSYMFLFGPERLSSGYSLNEVWRAVLILSPLGFLIQYTFFSPPLRNDPPLIGWLKLAFSIALSCILLIGLGASMVPQASSSISAVIFALPATFVIGLLSGFSPLIQRWILGLPEMRVAAIGALMILCAFALIFIQLFLNSPGIIF